MNRRKKIWLLTLSPLVIVVPLTLLLIKAGQDTPAESLENARLAISAAKNKGAGKYSPQLLKQAEDLYREAMKEWGMENERFIIKRDYKKVITLSQEATGVAEMSASASKAGSARMQEEISQRIDTLKAMIVLHDKILDILPQSEEMKQLEASGSLKLTEAGISYNAGDYKTATHHLQQAERAYQKLFDENEKVLNGYFADFERWQTWVNTAIKNSRKNQSVAIIVDKIGHKCLVYSKGRLLYTFDAELGTNWIGDKRHQGDQATPEGEYLVKAKLSGSHTKYYRALLINYPNADDRLRYAQNLQNGVIPEGKDIGGAVEIHGNGGRGFDWTNGCVALSDSDADKAYRVSKVGTPVIIVGSTRKLDELLEK